ncbi:MAG: GumC family protein [Candidatus Eisenbacteria bacterium]
MRDVKMVRRETTLRDFMAIVFRRKWIILAVLLAAIGTVLVLNATTPPSFVSEARLLIDRGEHESVYNSRVVLLSWEEELNSEMEVLRSPSMAEKAQKLLTDEGTVDSRGAPIRFDPTKVSVWPSGKSAVMMANYISSDPIASREGLRALTRAYINFRMQERALPVVDGFFDEEIEGLRDRLSEWEQRRADFMTEEGIVSIPNERESLLRRREDAEGRLADVRARAADYAARLEAVRQLQQEKRQNPQMDIFGIGDQEYDDEGLMFNLRKELVARRADYYRQRGIYTDDHPSVRAAKTLVEDLERQLDEQIESYARYLEARVAVIEAQQHSLESTVQGIDDMLQGMPDKEARLGQYDRIIQALRADYGTMIDRQVQAKVESTGRPTWKVSLLQAATEPERQRTRDYVRMALIPIFAILIGFALAFVIDGLDHSIKDATEAEEHLGVPVLGSLPKIR